jgi:hypothetical protein
VVNPFAVRISSNNITSVVDAGEECYSAQGVIECRKDASAIEETRCGTSIVAIPPDDLAPIVDARCDRVDSARKGKCRIRPTAVEKASVTENFSR